MMKKHLAGLALAFGVAFAAVPQEASATTVATFNAMATDDKARLLENAVYKIYDFYTNTKPDASRAACLRDLYTPASAGGISRGMEMLFEEIDKAAAHDPQRYHVEALLFGLISRECPAQPASLSPR